jgi:hypothetical protein
MRAGEEAVSGAADTSFITEILRGLTASGFISQRDKGDRSLRSVFAWGLRTRGLVFA